MGQGSAQRAMPLRLGPQIQALPRQGVTAVAEDEVPIGHLQRRKIESRVLLPFIEALEKEIGPERTERVVVQTIRDLARGDGSVWADRFGTDIDALERVADLWAAGDRQSTRMKSRH